MDARALGRGLVMRCPVCGTSGLFTSYFALPERCPTCALEFEREDGYWLGAMIVAMALVIVTFAAIFLGGLALTWPDVPWTGLTIVTFVSNAVVPVVAYPWCKTVWMGLHHAFVPDNRNETERPL
jgi:uncharacterized protein (DUF983 family)